MQTRFHQPLKINSFFLLFFYDFINFQGLFLQNVIISKKYYYLCQEKTSDYEYIYDIV